MAKIDAYEVMRHVISLGRLADEAIQLDQLTGEFDEDGTPLPVKWSPPGPTAAPRELVKLDPLDAEPRWSQAEVNVILSACRRVRHTPINDAPKFSNLDMVRMLSRHKKYRRGVVGNSPVAPQVTEPEITIEIEQE